MAKAILHTVGDLPHNSPELLHLGQLLEREEAPQPARLPGGADGAPVTADPGPNTDEGPEDLEAREAADGPADEEPTRPALAQALAFTVRGKNKQPTALADLRNSGLEAWLDWARGKLDADPESPRLQEIANACAVVLEARRAGVVTEPPKAEAA